MVDGDLGGAVRAQHLAGRDEPTPSIATVQTLAACAVLLGADEEVRSSGSLLFPFTLPRSQVVQRALIPPQRDLACRGTVTDLRLAAVDGLGFLAFGLGLGNP